MKVKFKKFSSNACLPAKSTVGSACFDIYSAKGVLLLPGETKTVDLDLGFQFSKKYVCRIYPRSNLSLKPLFAGGGVINSDYRGNISVILSNFSSWSVDIEKGDRIAQIMFLKEEGVEFEEVNEFDNKTVRDTKGFGSTGLKRIPC